MDMSNVQIPLTNIIDIASIQAEGEAIGQAECGSGFGSSQNEEQQRKYSVLSDSLRLEVSITDTGISYRYYFLEIPEGMEDEAELIIANAEMSFKSRIEPNVQDQINLSDVQSKIAEYVKPYIVEEMKSMLGGI